MHPTDYTITTFNNGITLVSEQLPHVQSFSIGMWFSTGSRDETKANNGISHFIEHMLFKGTTKRSARRISEETESLGGYINAFTTKEHTCFYGRGLQQHIGKTFEVLSDMILNPAFRQKDINNEQRIIIDELNDILDTPEEMIFEEFEEKLFNCKGVGLTIMGTEKSILSFTENQLREYYTKTYLSRPLLIVCSGNIEHNRLVDLTAKYLNGYKSGRSKKTAPATVGDFFNTELISKVEQTYCIIGNSSVGMTDINRYRLMVLSGILGDGTSSRLFQNIREKMGISYQIQSFINFFSDISVFGVFFSTSEENYAKALAATHKEIEKLLVAPIGNKELKRAKEYLKGSFLLGLESTNSRMNRLANSLLYFGRVQESSEMIQEIDSITAEEILQTAKEFFTDSLSQIVIKPRKQTESVA